jgi:hypothetical protein
MPRPSASASERDAAFAGLDEDGRENSVDRDLAGRRRLEAAAEGLTHRN